MVSQEQEHRPQIQKPVSTAIQAKFQQGLALHQQGRLAEAERTYQEILQEEPNHFGALHALGAAALQTHRPQQGVDFIAKAIELNPDVAAAHSHLGSALSILERYQEALASYDRAIALKPDFAEAHNNRGAALNDMKRAEEALASCDKAIALKPSYAEAYSNRGVALNALKRHEEALASYKKAIALKPQFAQAHNNRGIALNILKRHEEALASCNKAIALKPDYAEAYYDRGIALNNLKRSEEALASCDKAIALRPSYAKAYSNRGVALNALKRHEEALASHDTAIALKPDFAEAHNNRGNALNALKRHEEALASYDTAIALKPDFAEAHNNRGNALNALKRHEEALASYERAIAFEPNRAEAHYNRGVALNSMKRDEEAIASYDKAIALKPDNAEAYNNRGNVLSELKRCGEAIASYDKAIGLRPDFAEAYNNRGNALNALKRHQEALASYKKAIAIKPDCDFLLGDLIHTKMTICDWSNLETQISQLVHKIDRSEKVSTPYSFLAATDSPELQRKVAEIYALTNYPLNSALPKIVKRKHPDKIRIGYFSADFREHNVAFLAAELFEKHNRSLFDVTAFAFGLDTRDTMRQRLEGAFDQFIDVRNQSDRDVALLARKLEIDIAVDLGGFTADNRTNFFAMRAAPVQVNYLGYSGTMGATYMDYLIADTTIIPALHQKYYTEKIAYLPNSYMPNDLKCFISDQLFDRAELGLPQSGFVFCFFSNSYKLNPRMFDCWMAILKKVEGSVLWLSYDNSTAVTNLKKEAGIRDVNPDRLVFANRIPLRADHLARHRLADLFLDTLPWNAHTTASNALWAGLPVLTQIGASYAGRSAASLLNAIGLPELITSTPQEYEAVAIDLATNPAKLADIKRKLANNRLTTPLFDAQLFAKHIEAAYTAMYERYQADLPPDHIYVKQEVSLGGIEISVSPEIL